MTNEQWEYITTNWGTSDQNIMEEIAKIKETDASETAKLHKSIEEKDKTIQDLTKQNVDVNRTNLDLMLRLTDPKNIPPDDSDSNPEDNIPEWDDLDAFVK